MAQTLSPDALRIGTVTAVDFSAATARVEVGDIETIMVPWGAMRAGRLRVWSPPCIGEQVSLLLPEGDWEGAYIAGSLFCDDFPPPDDSAKTLLLFDDGAVFSYDPEGGVLNMDMSAPGGSAVMKVPGGLAVEGDVAITGNVGVDGLVNVTQDVIADGVSLTDHKHGQVAAGGAQSGIPV